MIQKLLHHFKRELKFKYHIENEMKKGLKLRRMRGLNENIIQLIISKKEIPMREIKKILPNKDSSIGRTINQLVEQKVIIRFNKEWLKPNYNNATLRKQLNLNNQF